MNNFKSRKEKENFIWKTVIENIVNLKSEKDIKKFLELLLSDSDKKIIINRFLIISLLKEGKSYKEISKICWVSPGTISAIKKSLKENSGYKSRYLREKNRSESEQKSKRERINSFEALAKLLDDLNLDFPTRKVIQRF